MRGVPGAQYRKCADRAAAERLLRGDGLRLAPGQYAFVGGNAAGGVGVVLVWRYEDGTTGIRELGTTVAAMAPSLASHLHRLRNPPAELAALDLALEEADHDA